MAGMPVHHGVESLFIDLVPSSAWFSNLRSEVLEAEWGTIKSKTFRAANYRCEACGGQGSNHPVECHERWIYDEERGVQILLRTIALCPACHEATHFGLARVKGRDKEARQQLQRVNHWTDLQVDHHVDLAMADYRRRSTRKWILDAYWLLDFIPASDPAPLSKITVQGIWDHAAGLQRRLVDLGQSESVAQNIKRWV